MTGRHPTSAQAVEATSINDRFTALYNAHGRSILASAYRRVGDYATAEDLVESVFRAAWIHRENADEVFNHRWLYRTLENVVGNEYRRRNRAAALFLRLASMTQIRTSERNDPTDVILVQRAIASLSTQDQELLGLVYHNDLARVEAADLLGISVDALNHKVMRARRKLLAILEDQGGLR
ncbi:MAG: RNA polymerase sigma factor [Propionicimonas sp.]